MTRRRYTEEQKLAVVREAVETGNCAVVGRRHGIAENLVSRLRQFRALGESPFTGSTSGGSEDV
ncbi:MAG: transposase [Firmicutes bacterium]|nr:transposase [Bacillota bacterium]